MSNSGKIQSLLSKGKTEEVLNILMKESENLDKDVHDHIILLSNRFNRFKGERIDGIISNEDYNLEINKINYGLISLLQENPGLNFPNSFSNIHPDTIRKLSKYSMYAAFITIPFFSFFLYPKDAKLVHHEPKIEGDSIVFRFFKFNTDEKQDTFKFYFELTDTANFSLLIPSIGNFEPKELADPNRSSRVTESDDPNQLKKSATRNLYLKNINEFGWVIKIRSISGKSIKKNNFYFDLTSNNTDIHNSRQIEIIDYFNIYPFFFPILIIVLGLSFKLSSLFIKTRKHEKLANSVIDSRD